MRARTPDVEGFVARDEVKVGYEVFGSEEPTVLLAPFWQNVPSRGWKGQVHDLARSYRVVTFDARGTGRSDRPGSTEQYAHREIVADAVAVLDAAGADTAVWVGVSRGAIYCLEAAAWHPSRVRGVVAMGTIGPCLGAGGHHPPLAALLGLPDWDGYRRFGLDGHADFVEFFSRLVVSEPHRTTALENLLEWGLDTTPEVLLASLQAPGLPGPAGLEEICRAVRCPALVVHGDRDRFVPLDHAERIAELLGVGLVTVEGGGHVLPVGDPVRCNLLIREFVASLGPASPAPPRTLRRALTSRRRALVVSSPVGLGHARRDLAIADELRALHPDLEIDWLTQDPATRLLAERGERLHPAARFLAGESAHLESEAGEHDLHVFRAFRRMDEILVANFMVFQEIAEQERYDLVVADEGWDVDYFLHENPDLKRSPFAWLTDFVGFLPVPDGGAAEAVLTADHNAEMIEQVARHPRLRDRSVFVGDPGDVVEDPLGPGLPGVRAWTEAHFDFAGYVVGSEPPVDREALRAELVYRPGERVVVVTVGGTGVGRDLLRRVVEAFPIAARRVPGLRMVVVAGPRIDPASVPAPPGVEVHGFVPDLHRVLAVCDLAVVQGGLSTTMELVAARRPFLYFPLARHFEQQIHVPHRLDRYRAGRRMDYATTDPDLLAAAIVEELDRPVDYRPVATDGARRAAVLLGDLL